MNAKKSLLVLAFTTLVSIALIAVFNFLVNPLCYNCEDIDVNKATLNRYYQVAQLIVSNPDTEQIILGSSRGQTTSDLWVQKVSGLKSLNLSIAGAEVIAKTAFLKLAQEKMKLKRIIWYADYFELISTNADPMFRNTKSLTKYANGNLPETSIPFKIKLQEMQKLFDHNTTEASIAALNKSRGAGVVESSGRNIDYDRCAAEGYNSNINQKSLDDEVDLIYQSYVNGAIKPALNVDAMAAFQKLISELNAQNILVTIVIPPYHPNFLKRLILEKPNIYQAHLDWIKHLESLKSDSVEVANFFAGIPNDDGTAAYWNDGSHFTCRGVIAMLKGQDFRLHFEGRR